MKRSEIQVFLYVKHMYFKQKLIFRHILVRYHIYRRATCTLYNAQVSRFYSEYASTEATAARRYVAFCISSCSLSADTSRAMDWQFPNKITADTASFRSGILTLNSIHEFTYGKIEIPWKSRTVLYMQNINFVKKCNNNFLHNVCGSIELKPQKKIGTICNRLDIDKTVIYGTRI